MRKTSFLFKGILSLAAALYGAFGLQNGSGWALGNNVASYTYTGNQQGLTTNTVYTLSTYGQYLGACALQPGQSTNSGYTANCFTNYGDQNSSLYSAVAFLGVVNNPSNAFVVGDNDGYISIATQQWEMSNGRLVSPRLQQSSKTKVCLQGGSVSNLTVDPNGAYLYIGCSVNAYPGTYGKNLFSYYLYSSQISPDGSLGSPDLITGLFDTQETRTAALWNGVSPVMRAYPPNSVNLQNSVYSASGVVMVSGLVGKLVQGQSHKAIGQEIPVSSGLVCSNGQCRVAYNITLEAKDSFSIITAAEVGIDSYASVYGNALYWNQVAANWNDSDDGKRQYPQIQWNKTSNTIYSCNISDNPVGTPATRCGQNSYALSWAAQGMPSAGNGYQVDISNLLYVPTPAGITTAFTKGLLVIGTYTNGYLAYHSPALQNSSTSLFLSGNGAKGQVGNINSLMSDTHGNLMVATSSSGLFVFNPFGGQNVANGSNITLIPNESDGGSQAGCTLCKIEDFTEILYYGVKLIGTLAAKEPARAANPAVSPPRERPVQDRSTPHNLAPMLLSRVLGTEPYRGQFRYTEQDLRALGVTRGQRLSGLSFRVATGMAGHLQDQDPVALISINIRREKNGDSALLKGKQQAVASHGDLSLFAEKSTTADYLRPIMLPRPIIYTGGDLILTVSHGARRGYQPVSIDAFQAFIPQGSAGNRSTHPHEIRVLPLVRFVSR